MESFGRRKTSGFLILDRSEQRQLNANHLSISSDALPAGYCQHPRPGMQDFPQNSRQLDSLAVCDRVHVIMTDLEEADNMQAPGDLVG